MSKLDCSLQKWAVDLTQRHKVFTHDQQHTPEHFSNLTKDERLQPILTFMMRHIRPPEEQRQIKLNLKHAQLRKKLAGAECETSTSEERYRLKAAVIDARSTVTSEVAEIQQLSQKKEEYRQQEVDFKRRAALLKVVEGEREREIQHCRSWNSQLLIFYDSLETRKSKTPSVIDPSLQRLLRSNLLNVESLRHSIVNGDISQGQIHKEKVQLWEDIQDTLQEWGPRSIMRCLLGEVREGSRNLQSLIQRVDLAKDAHELRLKCEKDGSFIDEMNPGGVIESVRELLGQMSAAHVRLFIEAHRADEAAASLSRVLNTVTNNISAAAKRTYGDDETASSVTKLINENISVVGERAALNMTQTLASSLQERADIAARARDALRSKYAQIVSFNKEVKMGVESIHCLAVSVKDGLDNINTSLEKVKSDISDALETTTQPTPVSVNALRNECLSFRDVPLGYLLTFNIDEYGWHPKVKMTTTPLVWYDKSQVDDGWSAASTLCSGQLCWDGVYNRAVDISNDTTSLQNQMEQLISLRAAVSSPQNQIKMLSSQEVKELNEAAEKSDAKLDEEVRQLVGAYEKQISGGTQHLSRVTKLLTEWWEQPAKRVTITKTV